MKLCTYHKIRGGHDSKDQLLFSLEHGACGLQTLMMNS